jgi:CRP/FNR family cyclic AMP-dependent transcriptional regulator
VLHRLAAGDCFGEMALMDLFPRSASVRAEQDCSAIELAASDLLRLFEHDAEQFALIQMNIGREISRRLRTTDELLFRASMGETDTQPAGLFRSS